MRTAVLVAVLSACEAPAPPLGLPCVDDVQCPPDQRCLAGRCGGAAGAGELPDAVPSGDGDPPDAPAPDPPRDAPAATGCDSADTCAAATSLGAISGDTGSPALSATGYRAAWFRVRVTENDSNLLGRSLSLAARLVQPAAVDFAVFIYVNAATDAVECTTASGTPSGTSTTDRVQDTRATWGETLGANGVDDGRDVSIEVRPLSGACDPGQPWQLSLVGNAN